MHFRIVEQAPVAMRAIGRVFLNPGITCLRKLDLSMCRIHDANCHRVVWSLIARNTQLTEVNLFHAFDTILSVRELTDYIPVDQTDLLDGLQTDLQCQLIMSFDTRTPECTEQELQGLITKLETQTRFQVVLFARLFKVYFRWTDGFPQQVVSSERFRRYLTYSNDPELVGAIAPIPTPIKLSGTMQPLREDREIFDALAWMRIARNTILCADRSVRNTRV